MVCRWRRKDFIGVLELYRAHFIADYGVSQDLIETFLQRHHSRSPWSSRMRESGENSLVLSDHKCFPYAYSQMLVWDSMARLTYSWTKFPLAKLYEEFLQTVRESQGSEPDDHGTRQPTHRLPPAARLDAPHFAPFIRAFGSKWRPDRALQVVKDMKALGVRPTLQTWTLVLRSFARGQFRDATRANRILERARRGMPGVPARRSRVPCEPREAAVADEAMYRVALEAHVRRSRRKAAWDAYYELRKTGYQMGSNRGLDAIILDLFRLGRVRPSKRKPARAGREIRR